MGDVAARRCGESDGRGVSIDTDDKECPRGRKGDNGSKDCLFTFEKDLHRETQLTMIRSTTCCFTIILCAILPADAAVANAVGRTIAKDCPLLEKAFVRNSFVLWDLKMRRIRDS
jgi:hypothetical protein